LEEMNPELDKIAAVVYERLLKYNLKGRTVILKIKYSDFRIITRSKSFDHPLNDLATIQKSVKQLMAATFYEKNKIRLLGVGLSNFGDPLGKKTGQGELF
jgi:DNA polymerase-4